MSSDLCNDLVSFLQNCPEDGIPVRNLPKHLLNPDMLACCDADGLIEFGSWYESRSQSRGEHSVKRLWRFTSWTQPGRLPIRDFLPEVLQKPDDDGGRMRADTSGPFIGYWCERLSPK